MRADPAHRPLLAPAFAALALAVLAGGCSSSPDRTPRLDRLVPAGGTAAQAAAVTIRGRGFFPRIVQSASGGAPTIDPTHRAWLDGQPLGEVTWVDAGTLRVTIPAGLALGPHDLTVENGLGFRATLAGAWTVIQPAVLSAAAHPSRSTASTGQGLSLEVTVRNGGGTALQAVALTVIPQGAGGVTLGAMPAAVDLPAGASAGLSVPLTAASSGPVTFRVEARGVEALSGRDLLAAADAGTVVVQDRAVLVASLAIPSTIPADSGFTVTMTVANLGEAAALAVAPGTLAPVAGGTGALASLAGPTPAQADVPGQGSATFTWAARLQAGGTVQVEGGAAGTDENDGGAVESGLERSNLGTQQPEVAPVAADPLGDGTPAAALAVRGGTLIMGPSLDGRTFWRLDAATGAAATTGVEIAVDLGSSPADDAAWRASPPATTFGAAGCAKGTLACGPSNESGRGVLAAGAFAGAEWLLYAPASVLKAQNLYLARGETTPLSFQTVDLAGVLPVTTVATTAVGFVAGSAGGGDRLYLALTDKAAKKSPYLVALTTAPSAPWLDAAAGTDAVELGVAGLPGLGGGASVAPSGDPQPRVDAILQYRGLLYLAGGGAVWRSAVATPRSFADHAGDWALTGPLGWSLKTSLPAAGSVGLTPADRAVPGLVSFGSCGAGPCLYLARNVKGGTPAVVPQLWTCDPTRSGDADACDIGDWSLAVPNPSGDRQLTQLGVPTHGAVSVLLATARYLYLGFDDATTGAQLYRSEVAPVHRSDFKGRDGCAAGEAGCVGLGGAGFGDPARTRFLDARAVTAGGQTTVFVVAGDAQGPLHLFAVPE